MTPGRAGKAARPPVRPAGKRNAHSPTRVERSGGASEPAVESTAAPGGNLVTTVRLPLVTATFTRQPRSAGPVTASGAASGGWQQPCGGASWSRLALYAGAVALGVLEIVEWPVTALIAAGVYVSDKAMAPIGDPAAKTPDSKAAVIAQRRLGVNQRKSGNRSPV